MDDRYSFGVFNIPFPLKSFQSNPFKSRLLDTPDAHSIFRTHLSNLRQSISGLDIKSLTSDDHITSLYIVSICYKFEPYNSKYPELSTYSSSLISKLVSECDNHAEWDNKINQFFELILSNLKTWENKFYQIYYLALELLVKKGYRFLKGFNDNIFNHPTFYIILSITKLLAADFSKNIDLYTDHLDINYISDNQTKACFVFPDRNPRTRTYLLSKHLHVLTQILEHLPKNHQVYSSFHWIMDFYRKLYQFSKNKRLYISGFKLLVTAFPNEISHNNYFVVTELFGNITKNVDITQIHLIVNTLIHCLSDLKSSSFAQMNINRMKIASIFIINASALISRDEPDAVFDCNLYKLFFYLLNTFPNTLMSLSDILIGDNIKDKDFYLTVLKGFDILLDYTLKCSSVSDNIESAIPLVLVISMLLKSTSGKALSRMAADKRKSIAKLVVSNFFYNTTPGNAYEKNLQSLFNLSLIDGLLNSALKNDVLDSLKERCNSIADTVSSSFVSGDLKRAAGGLLILDYFSYKSSVDRKGVEAGVCFEKDVFVRFLCHLTSLKSSKPPGSPLDSNVIQIGLFGLARLSPQLLESLTQNYAKYYFKGLFGFTRNMPFSNITSITHAFPLFILHYNVIFPLISNDPYRLSVFKGMISLEKSEYWESKLEAIEKNFNEMKLELVGRAEAAEKENQKLKGRCHSLDAQVTDLKNELISSEKKFERALEQERINFNETLSQNNNKLLNAHNKITALQKSYNETLAQRDMLNNELGKVSQDARELQNQLNSYKSNCEMLTVKIKSFEEVVNQFEALKQQYTILSNQHENLSKLYEDCIRKLILIVHCFFNLKKESSEKKAVIEDQHQQIGTMQAYLQERDKEIAVSKLLIQNYKHEIDKIERIRDHSEQEIIRLSAEVSEKDMIINKAKSKYDQFQNKYQQLAQNLEHKNREFQMLQAQIAEKERDLTGTQQKLKTIANVVSGI